MAWGRGGHLWRVALLPHTRFVCVHVLVCARVGVWVRQFKREACWALSNISAGPAEHRQAVFDAGVLRQVVQLASVRRGIAVPCMQRVPNVLTSAEWG